MSEGGELALPGEHEEHAAYIAELVVWCGAERIEASRMIVFVPGSMLRLHA